MSIFYFPFSVSEQDLIEPYEHVHHADILRFLEQARVEFLNQIKHPLEEFYKNGLFPVLRRIKVEYLREIKVGEYRASCQDAKINRRELLLKQIITNDRNKIMLQADLVLMIFSKQQNKAVFPTEKFEKAFLDCNKV